MFIRSQADDFLNAYHVLQENGDAIIEEIHNDKKTAFEMSASDVKSPLRYTGGVPIVCLSFAVELYIKNLHYVLKGKVPRGHNILKLFKELPHQTKRDVFFHDEIIQNPFITRGPVLYPRRFSGVARDYYGFIKHLEAISDSFATWRYAHEHTVLQYDAAFALAFIKALTSVIDSSRTTN